MIDQLEADLREVFALRAAQLPPDAVERLCRVDYRPRTRRRWPLTMSALGAGSGTAAVVSAVVLGGSQSAFAGWSATPTAPTPAQTTATLDSCQAHLVTMPAGQGSWSQVASDVRGPYTMAVYQDGTSFATCFTGPSFSFASFNSAGGQEAVSASGSVPPGQAGSGSNSIGVYSPGGGIDQLVVSHLSQSGNGPYTLVEGRLDSAVSAVSLVLSDGQDVTATTVNGWFVAWWPGSADATAAQITTASGTTAESLKGLPDEIPSPPAPGSSTGSGAVPVSPGSPTVPPGT